MLNVSGTAKQLSVLADRIRLRAYYLAENAGWAIDPVDAWLAAEMVEVALYRDAQHKRSLAAAKGARTKAAGRLIGAGGSAPKRNALPLH